MGDSPQLFPTILTSPTTRASEDNIMDSVSLHEEQFEALPVDRAVEIGYVLKTKPRSFTLVGVGAPCWLLALEKTHASKVHVFGHSSPGAWVEELKLGGCSSALANLAAARLGLGTFIFLGDSDPPLDSTILISGPADFLSQSAVRWQGRQCLLLLNASARSRPRIFDSEQGREQGKARWLRLRHSTFGGATNYAAWLGLLNVELDPVKTGIRRNISHVIDHSLRPERWSSGDVDLLHPEDRLDPSRLTQVVRYATHFSHDGWGVRSLTPDEVGVAFGLPSWLRPRDLTMDQIDFVPIQILDGCLQALCNTSDNVTHLLPTPQPRCLGLPPTRTWLPSLGKWLPHEWVNLSLVTAKAAKRDDAAPPTDLWDNRINLVLPWATSVLSWLRFRLMMIIRKRLMAEFCGYMRLTHGDDWASQLAGHRAARTDRIRQTGGVRGATDRCDTKMRELLLDAAAGADVIHKIANASWWSWDAGSTLLFWRWPAGEQRSAARDGMTPWIQLPLPQFHRRVKRPAQEKFDLMIPKFKTILDRGYVTMQGDQPLLEEIRGQGREFVESFMEYFYVDKVGDIRMVYNGTSCGLNPAVWAPNFWMPTGLSATRVLDFNFCNVDVDLGECFLNFPLPLIFRHFSGINLKPFKEALGYGDVSDSAFVTRWERCWMGFRPSPYYSVRFYYWAEEFGRGNPKEKGNPLRWDEVRLNLPGDHHYDPTYPRVMKWNLATDSIAGDVLAFVDDLRMSGMDEEQAWQVARQIVSRLQYLGIQDAPRKRRPSVRDPGAWAGGIFSTTKGKVTKKVSQEKWDKARRLISELATQLGEDPLQDLDYKQLERARGFLCHLSMTHDMVTPFLKGFHLTLAGHLPKRDEDGWKMQDRPWEAYIHQQLEDGKISDSQARLAINPPDYDDIPTPKVAKPAQRLPWDLEALGSIFGPDSPPEVVVRSLTVYTIKYGFGDASGKGFGSTITTPKGIRYRIGTWESDAEGNSSNWREFENIVETLEEEAKAGHLKGSIVFLFTDNSTCEAAIFKGNSSSRKLFDLVVRLKTLELAEGARFIISHCSGERMKAEGTDGVSRGHMKEGVIVGADILSFVPLNESALKRSPGLKGWIQTWAGPEAEFLTPDDWFTRGHDHLGGKVDAKGFWWPTIKSGTFVWTPPPAAAAAALEELRKARIKRQNSSHIFVCPRLMTPEWMKQLYKASDIVFVVPVGSPQWPTEMYEPLTIGLCLPFLRSAPWQLRGTPKMLAVGRQMRSLFKEEGMDGGRFLRKFLLECWRLPSLSPDVVWRLLHFRPRDSVSRPAIGRRRGRKRKIGEGLPEAGESMGKKKASRR